MQRLRIPILSAAAALILATPALASAQAGLVVEQKSTYNIARIGNADLKQKVMFHGNDRQKTVTEGRMRFLVFSRDAGGTEIVRLDQGQIHRLDDRRRQYQTNSIADLRVEFEKAQKDAEAAAPESRQQDDVRLWVEAEPARRTGERKTINGFSTEQVIFQATVMGEDTRTGEKSPVFHLIADAWIDPSQAQAAQVSRGFMDAYMAQLGVDPRIPGNPYGPWIRDLFTEIAKVDGLAIVAHMVLEAEPEADGAEGRGERAADNTDPVGAAVGAMMRRVARPQEQPTNPAATGRPLLFSMSNEVLSISAAAPAASEFEIPGGYRKR